MELATVDWNYAISTLIIRFVGIFVVLAVLQVVIQITGRIFAHLDGRNPRDTGTEKVAPSRLSEQEAAAVAMALLLHERAVSRRPGPS